MTQTKIPACEAPRRSTALANQPSGQSRRTITAPERIGQVRIDPAVPKLGAYGSEVWGVQFTLSRLGYTGRDGRPLATDRHFGPDTDHAVRAFQRRHGLQLVDGRVSAETRAALLEATRHPLISEAAHPSHDLFCAIAGQLPPGTDPRVAANIALQAMEHRITGERRLARITARGSDAYGTKPGHRKHMDPHAPSPAMQDTSDQTATQGQSANEHAQGRARPPPPLR